MVNYNMGDTIEKDIFRETRDPETEKKRRIRRPSLMAIGIIIAIALGAFNTIAIQAALRNVFPNQQTFSVGVAYSFADTQGSVLLPGSTGNVSLTINSALAKPSTIFLSFNATNPQNWGYDSIPSGYGGTCYPAVHRDLTMKINGGSLLPENTDLSQPGLCSDTGNPPPAGIWPVRAAVTVNPGTNVFTAYLSIDANSKIATTFTLNWFATQ